MFSSIAVTPAWEVTVEGKELLRCYCRPRCCCFFFFSRELKTGKLHIPNTPKLQVISEIVQGYTWVVVWFGSLPLNMIEEEVIHGLRFCVLHPMEKKSPAGFDVKQAIYVIPLQTRT